MALLAILKAGGAYVPIDPAFPAQRIALMIEDSQASVILATTQTKSRLPKRANTLFSMDGNAHEIAQNSTQPVRSTANAQNLAYVIYTSGSTGKPKGVMIEHRNVLNFFQGMDAVVGPNPGVWLAVTSISFDISVLELFWTLTRGFQVVVHGDEGTQTIPEEIREFGVTHMQCTPSLARMIALAPQGLSSLGRLEKLLLGGEALPLALARQLRQVFRGAMLNMYGPTETTIWSTTSQIDEDPQNISIGKPIRNTQVYVLDGALRPVKSGIVGDLFIGGDGVVRGYWQRPELTAERFLDDPFLPGNRMYRTGDLARFLPDGSLEFLGRADFQVKLRGFRIEIGEIEAALESQAGVAQAVVVARDFQSEGNADDKRLVAYVVPKAGYTLRQADLRSALTATLPEYMIPSIFMVLDSFPLTANGKVDRNALPKPVADEEPETSLELPRNELEEVIAREWQEALGVEQVGLNRNFFDLGAHSLMVAEVHMQLQQSLGREISLVDLFQFPTVSTLAAHLSGQTAASPISDRAQRRLAARQRVHGEEMTRSPAIAIVGMAGRFPGAPDLAKFWQNLKGGVESIRSFSDAELFAAGVSREELSQPEYVKSGVVLEDMDMFDAAFFGFSPRDASIMDPQHRVFLECAWEALENAGHGAGTFEGSVGVYAGSGMNSYMIHNLLTNPALVASAGLFLIRQTGNDKDVLATRVSYELDLRGPSISVQTACSTSLVAVHLACQSLLNQECDMALAGGSTIEFPHGRGYLYREGEILSRDGHCRAFDADSSGTVFSSGAGIVVLRRLEDALADGDTIHAVILGSAINNDGARKAGYLAPSVDGQAEAIAEALGVAGVEPADISYIETHGTGTRVGDPIEIKALAQALRQDGQAVGSCSIGSLKTNIGHLDTAAGVAGLIKTVLSLKHRQIPPSLHFRKANPLIDFANSPFRVNTALKEWKTSSGPRRAGVTSLGIGGTNAHVVLEEAPASKARAVSRKPYQLVVLSAKSGLALDQLSQNLGTHLGENRDLHLQDVAFTCQVGRKSLTHRRAVVAANTEEASVLLRGESSGRVFTGEGAEKAPEVVFMFSGQGSQHVNMGRELYETEPIFRAALDSCAECLIADLQLDLRTLLYPSENESAEAAEKLSRTRYTQPALFSLEYALAQWWISRGIAPAAMIGHSIGEYVAACLAGVFSLEDGLHVTAFRGRLMDEMPRGSMLAISASPDGLEIPKALSLAAVNGT